MATDVPVRRLILMRHAKSSWDSMAMSDHQRPLNKRGKRDAPRMAQELVRRAWVPDVVVASDSVRTTETWNLMAPHMGKRIAAYFEASLYAAGKWSFRKALRGVPDEVGTVLILAHNPGCESALTWFSGLSEIITTANCVLLEADGNTWDEVAAEPGLFELIEVLRPKEL